jgi:Domain of unknown function (DUF6916)
MHAIDDLNCQSFRELLHTDFAIEHEGTGVALKLIEVAERTDLPRQEQFTLTFEGPMGVLIPQRIHTFEHPALGPRDLFVVPIGPHGAHMRYEVIFNRLRPTSK